MEKKKIKWQSWVAKQVIPLSVGVVLLFFCLWLLLLWNQIKVLEENNRHLLGVLYLQEQEGARIAVNEMMRDRSEYNRGEVESAAVEAIINYGYTEADFHNIQRRVRLGDGVLLMAGGILLLLFGVGIAFCWYQSIISYIWQLERKLQQGGGKMKKMMLARDQEEQRKEEEALVLGIQQLRRESEGFQERGMQQLGKSLALCLEQYQILWENQSKLRQQMKRFTENIAHQMKTPLTRITLALDMMGQDNLEDKRDQCLQEVEQITPLVEGILNISRMESGRVTIQSKPMDLLLVLQEAVQKTGQRETYQWEFHGDFYQGMDSQELIYYGDEVWLTQAFYNLYENAVRYTSAGGRITTLVTSETGGILVEIHNVGEGIPEEAMQSLFERFFTADSQDLTRTGIGLNLARAVFERHQGRLQVRNEDGAVFSIFLPVYPLKDSRVEWSEQPC